jgi:hypothetical protein
MMDAISVLRATSAVKGRAYPCDWRRTISLIQIGA